MKLKELAENHLNIIIQRNSSNYVLKNIRENDREKDSVNATENKDENENENKNKIEIIEKIDEGQIPTNPTSTSSTSTSTPRRLGHDSVEDASTAMRLVYLKIRKGPQYGTKIGANSNARISLSQFFIGTGIDSRIRLENEDDRNIVINDETDSRFNQNDDKEGSDFSTLCSGEHSTEHSLESMDISPETSFFFESLSESQTMRSCLRKNSTFHPCGPKDELLLKIQNYFGIYENENKTPEINENIKDDENNKNGEFKENENENVIETKNKIIGINRKKNSLKPQKFCYFGLKYSNDKKELEIKETISKLQSILESNGPGSLLIITAQPPLSLVTNLLKQKKACENAQSVSRWTATLDFQLKDAYLKCNKTHMITIAS